MTDLVVLKCVRCGNGTTFYNKPVPIPSTYVCRECLLSEINEKYKDKPLSTDQRYLGCDCDKETRSLPCEHYDPTLDNEIMGYGNDRDVDLGI